MQQLYWEKENTPFANFQRNLIYQYCEARLPKKDREMGRQNLCQCIRDTNFQGALGCQLILRRRTATLNAR